MPSHIGQHTITDLRMVRVTVQPVRFGWRCYVAKWLLYLAKWVGGIDVVWIGDASTSLSGTAHERK